MASMVAKACDSTLGQMKRSRNKRKFRADPPLADPSKIIPLPSNECTTFEFSAEKFEVIPSHDHTNGCDMCFMNQETSDALKLDLGLSCTTGTPEISSDDNHDADWSDLTESQLEELVLSNLNAISKNAINKIVASGYSEEVATKAILRSGLWYGCKDTVSNIVDNALSFLRSGQAIDPSREHCFEDLQQMEKYILVELVCLLREVRPFFSSGDAMWCLLICDMNVSHACAMVNDPLGSSFLGDVNSSGNSSVSSQSQLKTEPKKIESNISVPSKSNPCNLASIQGGSSLQPEASTVKDGPNSKPKSSLSISNDRPFSASGISSRKVSGISRREFILRQKSIHLEKHYRSKGASRSAKLSNFGGLVLDKKLKAVAESTGLNAKNTSFNISKAAGLDVPRETNSGFSSMPTTFGLETINDGSSLPVADTELSLSFPARTVANPMPISYSIGSSYKQWFPQDKKDEMVMRLVPRVKELQNQLQEWTEWANQKVMQAARRLGKDKAELKSLRQEKEEVERLKKEKQTLEDNTMKKLSEMENALRKASGQVNRANAAVRRLDVENCALRQEMEAAKLRAFETAASCQELLKREKKTLMKFQSWEKQKIIFHEELAAEKHRSMKLQRELQQAKDSRDQAEAKWIREETSKNDLLTQATSFKKEREQIEVSTKSKEDTIKSRAESKLEKYKDDIKRLEKEISRLRLKNDSSKIAALKRGIDGSYVSKGVTDFKNTPSALKDSAMTYISRMVKSTDIVKRERECVMCLSEEMSVVFLPCAHQVVCTMCNELHEKQGMKDCPSCRGTIQRRVSVRYAQS
ncbi:hypothetical protein ACJIZ3_017643 [Penstemon smallii]|uniref:RING-type domain-containing protein n=1 Tax=Penstemon smallii TaxID=265156 RepID=A0ABD3SWQ8_9LAMI